MNYSATARQRMYFKIKIYRHLNYARFEPFCEEDKILVVFECQGGKRQNLHSSINMYQIDCTPQYTFMQN